MGRRGRKAALFTEALGSTEAREGLERRWFERRVDDPRLAKMVTAGSARHEPFHRWFHFRQGFSPQLVRDFIRAYSGGDVRRNLRTLYDESPSESIRRNSALPILDPFCGSGTTVIECGRNRVPSIGIEAEEPLAFLVNAVPAQGFPDLPSFSADWSWDQVATVLTEPIHRAALLCTVASLHTSDGRPNRGAKPFPQAFADVVATIRADLDQPLGIQNRVVVGDARHLDSIADETVGAILASPPYLSRYDYPQLLRPLEAVYRSWFPGSNKDTPARQIPAGPQGVDASADFSTRDPDDLPNTVRESVTALLAVEQHSAASLVRKYFLDMFDVIDEWRRVLAPGGPAWMVVGGARLKDVYIPSDLILAEYAEKNGFAVEGVRVARRLIDAGRKLGRLHNVSPRETVVLLRSN